MFDLHGTLHDIPYSLTGWTDRTNTFISLGKDGVCKNVAREGCPCQHTEQGKLSSRGVCMCHS